MQLSCIWQAPNRIGAQRPCILGWLMCMQLWQLIASVAYLGLLPGQHELRNP